MDPFIRHFEREMVDELQQECRQEKSIMESYNIDWPSLGRIVFRRIKYNHLTQVSNEAKRNLLSDLEVSRSLTIPEPPNVPLMNPTLNSLHIKTQLQANLSKLNQVR